ncbi:TIM barrel protein [Candidatus Woesearchaeota archaeon]|nr:TIM barrel protein [Candidatus Woesearchaeota archaeon]
MLVWPMDMLRFGTAGIPLSTPQPNTINGIKRVAALGLGCMELEFVQSVNIGQETAQLVKTAAEQENVVLTCHGPYYVNLNAVEQKKREQSKQRMVTASRRAWECGAWSIAFHLGFYLGGQKEKVYHVVKAELQDVSNVLHDEGIAIGLRAETTGKPTQFGDVDELLQLSAEIEGVLPCIDFAHLHARSGGKFNTHDEFSEVLSKVENTLGKEGLKTMHIHMAGIAYSEKGERHHLELAESDMNYKALVQAWKDFHVAGAVISESPNIEADALLLKKTYGTLSHR